jgi:regulator of protease activity HflC (stomatin/prohibitin superfamily)
MKDIPFRAATVAVSIPAQRAWTTDGKAVTVFGTAIFHCEDVEAAAKTLHSVAGFDVAIVHEIQEAIVTQVHEYALVEVMANFYGIFHQAIELHAKDAAAAWGHDLKWFCMQKTSEQDGVEALEGAGFDMADGTMAATESADESPVGQHLV